VAKKREAEKGGGGDVMKTLWFVIDLLEMPLKRGIEGVFIRMKARDIYRLWAIF